MIIFWIFITVVLLRIAITYQGNYSAISYLKKLGAKRNIAQLNDNRFKLVILIPALREQKNIQETLEYFFNSTKSYPWIEIKVITTLREGERPYSGKSTQRMILDFMNNNPGSRVYNVHYPYKHGYMAHQLNYAVKNNQADTYTYYAIYNADSRPDPDTFIWVKNRVIESHYSPLVLQQSAIFIKNSDRINRTRSFLVRNFLHGAALHQTRWTFAHELPRQLRSISRYELIRRYANAHCVGHGLFIQSKLLNDAGLFSQETMTEDLFLGYVIRSLGISIEPIPMLEMANSPTSMHSVFRQKYVWFWGPMYYPYYYFYVIKNHRSSIKYMFAPFIMMLQGVMSATSWILSGPIFIYLLIYPLLIGSSPLFIMSLLVFILYGPLQFMLIAKYINDRYKTPLYRNFWVLLGASINIFTHSVPPFFSMSAGLIRAMTSKTIDKPKTDD